MNGNGYDSELKASSAFFTKEQRQRVEAVTLARKLMPPAQNQVHHLVYLAQYICTGEG